MILSMNKGRFQGYVGLCYNLLSLIDSDVSARAQVIPTRGHIITKDKSTSLPHVGYIM